MPDGGCVVPSAPAQHKGQQANECISGQAERTSQTASGSRTCSGPRQGRSRPCDVRMACRAWANMGNKNQGRCGVRNSRFGPRRHRLGREWQRIAWESLGSTHGCTPHDHSIRKLRLERESGLRPRNRVRESSRISSQSCPVGIIDRPEIPANLNSHDENNEIGKIGAAPLRRGVVMITGFSRIRRTKRMGNNPQIQIPCFQSVRFLDRADQRKTPDSVSDQAGDGIGR